MRMMCFAIPSSDENRLKQIIRKIESMEAYYHISPLGKVVFKVLASDNKRIPLSENEARLKTFQVEDENGLREYLKTAGYSRICDLQLGTVQGGNSSTSM